MANTKAVAKKGTHKRVSDSLTKMVDQMNETGVQTLFNVFAKEAEEFKLDMERKKYLREELQLKAVDLNTWQTASDVI